MSITCCKDCTERYIDTQTGERCHSKCERYAQMVAENERIKQKEREYKISRYIPNNHKKKVQKARGR